MENETMKRSPQWCRRLAVLSAAFCVAWLPARSLAQSTACDLNHDSSTNVSDVQLSVNMVLGVTPCTATIVAPGVCDVVVVQRVVNAAIGGSCVVNSETEHNMRLTWSPSTSANIVGHNIYRGASSSGPFSKVNSALIGATNYTDSSVQGGQTYFYVVTAVNNSSMESAFSNSAQAVIPSP